MKTCTHIRSLVVDYVDGHLNEVDRQRVDAHLVECPTCRSQLAGERWLSGKLHQAAGEWPVEQLLVWPLRPEAPRPRRLRRRVFVATGLTALAVVVVVWRLPSAPTNETIASRSTVERVSESDEQHFADLQSTIEREACAAQLAMSAELLAAEPAAEQVAADALRFVAETFPETKAGRDAARRADLQSPRARESL
jgi:predicted anti-sigma-YlaC factor YlaD